MKIQLVLEDDDAFSIDTLQDVINLVETHLNTHKHPVHISTFVNQSDEMVLSFERKGG